MSLDVEAIVKALKKEKEKRRAFAQMPLIHYHLPIVKAQDSLQRTINSHNKSWY